MCVPCFLVCMCIVCCQSEHLSLSTSVRVCVCVCVCVCVRALTETYSIGKMLIESVSVELIKL